MPRAKPRPPPTPAADTGPLLPTYTPPEVLDTMTQRVYAATGWPIHAGARVRVRAPSVLCPGQVVEYRGQVSRVIRETSGATAGRALVLIWDGRHTRTALPATCWVLPTGHERRRQTPVG